MVIGKIRSHRSPVIGFTVWEYFSDGGEQYQIYRQGVVEMVPHPASIRTLDPG
ncbi:MAG: hypothetical protein J7M27_06405 [Candidatus Latescibacteria bacterium]|nr:hypothetical protein [Candidatus Latescibacterota bacterium]